MIEEEKVEVFLFIGKKSQTIYYSRARVWVYFLVTANALALDEQNVCRLQKHISKYAVLISAKMCINFFRLPTLSTNKIFTIPTRLLSRLSKRRLRRWATVFKFPLRLIS